MECAIMCCTCHTLTRSREIVLFFPLVKILQSDGSNYVILVMGKVSYYQIVIDHHELLEYIHMDLVITCCNANPFGSWHIRRNVKY